WTPASILIHSNCPTDRDRLLTTPAFPRTSKPRGPIRAERGSGTTATVMSASALRAMARKRRPSDRTRGRLLADRLAGINLRRRQHRKLQAHDVAEISAHGGPGPRGGDLAVRRLRAEQRLQWRLPGRGGRRYPEPRQRRRFC